MYKKENSTDYLRVFIALVIQYAKAWFIHKYGNIDLIKNKEIMWTINMGIPSAKFSADGENEKYITLLKTAYNLSEKGVITETNYKNIYNEEPDIECSIIPEIVATVSSFVTQEEGAAQALYCAIDIGAGTTDVCTFRIFEDNSMDKYAFYMSSVNELGVDRYNEREDKEKFLNLFYKQLGRIIWSTKENRDPYAEEWADYLPLIICGGGSYLKAYRDVIQDYIQDPLIKQLGRSRGFKGSREVPLPDIQYISADKVDPKRLFVAQGLSLSTDFYEIMKEKYISETKLENIVRKKKESPEEITKELC